MDYQIAQRTRYLLQTRVRRVKNAGENQYQEQLKFFLQFLNSNIVFSSVLKELEGTSTLEKESFLEALNNGEGYNFECELDYIFASYLGLKFLVDVDMNRFTSSLIAAFSTANGGGRHQSNIDEMLEDVNTYWLNYLYEFLDESIDNRNSILFVLKKYKQNAEWFRKKRLLNIANDGAVYGKKGEKGLALDLYESIHNDGIDFTIEPSSASGEVDLIANQSGEERVVLDAKYIGEGESSSQIKTKVVKAFRQVHDYCNDYNTSNGYILFYINAEVALDIESDELDGFRVVNLNGRALFFINVDIYENEKSASQRKALERVSIVKTDLIKDN
ncbi:hypothetical protein BMS_0782 [Halobacteriovorax marinus SJ]|uniref:Uncharacterized protein n=1 Tax=Halobacteriovorax marinus (strain ATCC BAA-682 / DSM 15412 / SJ) TaxID=862908 RepID=E1X5W7_HALMS|nr:hypothetical protein [Halobacteriovorax marinus]CBW25684.1 hypothetical protein BMS_0782 [Halobacteriovorax marinus SJ]